MNHKAGDGGRYGVDAPYALLGLTLGAAMALIATLVMFVAGWWLAWILLVATVYTTASAASYAYTTRRGKFWVWAEELGRVGLSRSARVLDLGCGRGAVLTWPPSCCRGERPPASTCDIRSLPFGDGSFDLVVSSLTIHQHR